MLLFAVVLPDQRLRVRPPRMTARVTPATFMFTTCRLFFLPDELGLRR